MSLFKLSCITLCAVLAFTDAWAFRCGKKVIDTGKQKSEVLAVCGEPSNIETQTISTVERCCTSDGRYYTEPLPNPMVTEEWTYNFGPHRLMQQLNFKNGVLESIKSLGYGYRD